MLFYLISTFFASFSLFFVLFIFSPEHTHMPIPPTLPPLFSSFSLSLRLPLPLILSLHLFFSPPFSIVATFHFTTAKQGLLAKHHHHYHHYHHRSVSNATTHDPRLRTVSAVPPLLILHGLYAVQSANFQPSEPPNPFPQFTCLKDDNTPEPQHYWYATHLTAKYKHKR